MSLQSQLEAALAVIGNDIGVLYKALSLSANSLTSNQTLYVSTSGNNTNDGLTTDTSFLTVQKALDTASQLDFNGYNLTIQVDDGVYQESVVIKPWRGSGLLFISGNPQNASAVEIKSITESPAIHIGSSEFKTERNLLVDISNLKISNNSVNGHGVLVGSANTLYVNNVDFGHCGGNQLYICEKSIAYLESNYKITGSGKAHIHVEGNSSVFIKSENISTSNSPVFSLAFISITEMSLLQCKSTSFSGQVKGTRFSVQLNSLINTDGLGSSYFPGNKSGNVGSGGRYV